MPQLMYNSLITSIPSKWKKMLEEDANVLNYYVFEDLINIKNVNRKLIEITTKDLYWHFFNDITEDLQARLHGRLKWDLAMINTIGNRYIPTHTY